MTLPFSMRRVAATDREAVAALCRAIDPDDWVPHSFDSFLAETPPEGLYLAEGESQGLVGCYHLTLPAPGEAYFSAMRISPGMQGQGLGSLFCRTQIEQAHAVGAEQIFLLSKVDNLPAHRTVMKNGFDKVSAWFIHDSVPIPAVAGNADRVRPGRAEDLPLLLFPSAEAEVACSPRSGWVVHHFRPQDLDVEDLAVAEGPAGPEGFMICGVAEDHLLIRHLSGTPAAARDLLAHAAGRARLRAMAGLSLSLPASAEPLLAPLGLQPEQAFRAYLFRHR